MRSRQLCGVLGGVLLLVVLSGGLVDLQAQENLETKATSPVTEAVKAKTTTAEKTSPPGQEETEAAKKKKAEADKKNAEAEKTEALEKIVVTATKTPRNPDDVPASITVITSKDIERQNIQDADEALAQVPGAAQRRSRFADTIATVILRGFPSSPRTLVLYDGQAFQTGSSRSVRYGAMPVEEIERIEVVRGPFSALYGGNAMGGVINFITKTPQKLEATERFGYATYDTFTNYVGFGDRLWDKLSFKFSWTYQNTAGYPSNQVTKSASTGAAATRVRSWIPSHTTTGGTTYIIGDTGDNSFWNSCLNAKVRWDIAPGHRVDLTVLQNWSYWDYSKYHTYLSNVATGQPVNQGTVGLENTNLRFSNLRVGNFLSGPGVEYMACYNLASEHQLSKNTTLKLRAGLLNQPYGDSITPGTSAATSQAGGPGTIQATHSNNWTGEAQLIQAIGAKQTLTGGVAVNVDTGGSKISNLASWRDFSSKLNVVTQYGGQTTNWGFYAQDEIFWHPMFSTVLGARLDWWTNFNGLSQSGANLPKEHLPGRQQVSFNPKVALLFRPWNWMTWRASAGTTFRPPTITELYLSKTYASGMVYQANPALKPETAVSWEVGTTLKPFKGNVVTATFFDNYVSDMIYRYQDPSNPGSNIWLINNAAEARIFGVEVEVTQKLFSWLQVFANTTILNARITKSENDPNMVGKKLTYVPRQQYNFGLNANYWIFNGNLTGRYVSKLPTTSNNSDCYNGVKGSYDPYFTLDAKLIVKPVKRFSMSFSVNNIMNREYYSYYLTPGRTFWLEAAVKY
jgi:iron complex outermembrane receptor protein